MSAASSSVPTTSVEARRPDSFWARLQRRRVPHILGLYLTGATSAILFTDWLVTKYALSPYLTDFLLLAIVLALPSVLVMAYKHGAPGRDPWTPGQFTVLGCNALGAVAVLLLLFGGKPLGATTETVTIETADGETVERRVAKEAFRKRVAVGYFDAAPGADAETLRWARLAVPTLFQIDLTQDLFATVAAPNAFAEKLRKAGFADGLGVPLALQRQLARESGFGHVLTGTVGRTPDGFALTTRLYDAESGRELDEETFVAPTLPAAVDAAARELRDDLELPSARAEGAADVPLAELTTQSEAALRAYATALHAWHFGQDLDAADAAMQEAIAADPTFAMAYLNRVDILMMRQQQAEALAMLRQAAQHEYRLTEPLRYTARVNLLFFEGQPDAAMQAAEQWATLYPDDTTALFFLGSFRNMRGEYEQALATYRRLLALDPNPGYHLTIGDLLRNQLYRPEEALAEYRAYVRAFPDQSTGHRRIGFAYEVMGRLDSALVAFDRAYATDPSDFYALGNRAQVLLKLGRFGEAARLLDDGIGRARTPQEVAYFHDERADLLLRRGQTAEALEAQREAWARQAEYAGAASVLRDQALAAPDYAEAGLTAEVAPYVRAAKESPFYAQGGFFVANVDLAEAALAGIQGEHERAQAALARAEDVVDQFGIDQARPTLTAFRARLAAYRGDHVEAVERYGEAIEENRGGYHLHFLRGRSLAEVGRAREARRDFEAVLERDPSRPEAHLDLARLAHARGDRADARRHLARALDAWADADPTYPEAQAARALQEEIRRGT